MTDTVKGHNPYPPLIIDIIKIKGTEIFFLRDDGSICSIDIQELKLSEEEHKFILGRIKKVKVEMGGLFWKGRTDAQDVFLSADVVANYCNVIPVQKLHSIIIKLYKNKKISKRFLYNFL